MIGKEKIAERRMKNKVSVKDAFHFEVFIQPGRKG
jgi:hypothetical protein